MKKFFLSILTLMYMTVSSGVAMEIHYCMGKEAGVDYYALQEKKHCGKCGMKEKKGGCCTDEHKFFKLEDSHKQASNDISFYSGDIALVNEAPVFDWNIPVSSATSSIHINSPPDDHGPSVCVMNCVFRL